MSLIHVGGLYIVQFHLEVNQRGGKKENKEKRNKKHNRNDNDNKKQGESRLAKVEYFHSFDNNIL